MMKTLVIASTLLCLSPQLLSQPVLSMTQQWEGSQGSITVAQWTSQLNSDLPQGWHWQRTDSQQSPGGMHIRHQLIIHDLPVKGATALLWLKPDGKALISLRASIPNHWLATPAVVGRELTYFFPSEQGLIACKIEDHRSQSNGLQHQRLWIDGQGNTLWTQNMLRHITDTVGRGFRFNPDPLTTANTVYGGSFVDAQDLNQSLLDSYRDSVELELTFIGGQFTLASSAAHIAEFDSPVVAVPTSINGDFFASRSDSLFEMVNALAHIQTQRRHLDSLGFTNMVNYSIPVDVNALGGSDNSAFDPNGNPPNLLFGEGGVDDAEDADVIYHEYAHAMVFSAAPWTSFGIERECIEEAIGDYFAASNSRRIHPFGWERVYSWDGHNPFWPGRMAVNNSGKMYPSQSFSNLYSHTDLFVDPLMRGWADIGFVQMDRLVIQSLYGYVNNMSMPQAANLILAADSALYNGQHATTLHLHFAKWLILAPQAGQETEANPSNPIRAFLIKGQDFAVPEELYGKQGSLYDSKGQRLQLWQHLPHRITLPTGQWLSLHANDQVFRLQALSEK